MSVMSELQLDIQMMLEQDVHPTRIARILHVPLSVVYDVLESMDSNEDESLYPDETVNS